MKIAIDYFPTTGWKTFAESIALTEALWKQFDEVNWHYFNFTRDTSVWESMKDGTVLYVAYDQSMIVQVYAENGHAEWSFDPIAAMFDLEKSQPPIS